MICRKWYNSNNIMYGPIVRVIVLCLYVRYVLIFKNTIFQNKNVLMVFFSCAWFVRKNCFSLEFYCSKCAPPKKVFF